jgi:hypothetical protein
MKEGPDSGVREYFNACCGLPELVGVLTIFKFCWWYRRIILTMVLVISLVEVL